MEQEVYNIGILELRVFILFFISFIFVVESLTCLYDHIHAEIMALIGHLHSEVMWPMFPLNKKLESCWYQKLTEHIKIISHLKLERKHI